MGGMAESGLVVGRDDDVGRSYRGSSEAKKRTVKGIKKEHGYPRSPTTTTCEFQAGNCAKSII